MITSNLDFNRKTTLTILLRNIKNIVPDTVQKYLTHYVNKITPSVQN